MKYDPVMYQPPESLEDFFEREEERVIALAAKFRIPEDLHEDFWMEIVEKFHRGNILDRYDAGKSQWATYLYRIVKNHASTFRDRLRKEGRECPLRFINQVDEEEGFRGANTALLEAVSYKTGPRNKVEQAAIPRVFFEQMSRITPTHQTSNRSYTYGEWAQDLMRMGEEGSDSEERKLACRNFLDKFGEFLKSRTCNTDSEGISSFVKRDPHWTFELMKRGIGQFEMAALLGVAQSSITHYKERVCVKAREFAKRRVA